MAVKTQRMHKVVKENRMVYHFRLFEKRKKTAEMPFRIGFALYNDKVSANLNIPFVLRLAAYYHPEIITEERNYYGIEHIRDFRIGKFFRTGFDTYKGIFAILFPVLRIWFQCDYFNNDFRQFGKFSLLIFLLKIKWNEFTFRIGIAGFRFSLRIAFD